MHAITGETWLLKLKFRVSRDAFRREELIERLNLKTLNQMDELAGLRQRAAGPLQDAARPVAGSGDPRPLAGRNRHADVLVLPGNGRPQLPAADQTVDLEDVMPWKKLGQRWHLMRKGFPPGKRVLWDAQVLEQLIQMLTEVAPDGQFHWTNQVLVHFTPPGHREPWATLCTKKPASLDLFLIGPKNVIGFGRVASLAWDRDLDATRPDRDVIRLSFLKPADLKKGDLAAFLREHLAAALVRR